MARTLSVWSAETRGRCRTFRLLCRLYVNSDPLVKVDTVVLHGKRGMIKPCQSTHTD